VIVCLFEHLAGIFSTRKTRKNGPAKQHFNKICEICENLWKIGDAFLRDAGDIGGRLVGTPTGNTATERCVGMQAGNTATGCFASHAASSLKPFRKSLKPPVYSLFPIPYPLKSHASSLKP